MSFAVFQQLSPSSVVDCCLFASFTSADANNLVLSRGDRLEVYELHRATNRLVYSLSIPLFGRPEAIGSFRPRPGAPENLALVFRKARYLSVLRYDPDLGSARTCGQHLLIAADDPAAASLPVGFQPQISVDPENRCVAVRSMPDRVVVFPVADDSTWALDSQQSLTQLVGGLPFHQDSEQPSGLRAPFSFNAWSDLRLHHVEDLVFLPGYHQPTVACLGQAKPSWGALQRQSSSSVLIVVLDLVQRSPHLVWATNGLPHDVFRLVPLPPPSGGILALAKNSVIYMKEHGSAFRQALNPAGLEEEELVTGESKSELRSAAFHVPVRNESKLDILLTGCSATVLSPTVVLFSMQPSGRLYLAHLVLTGQDAVTDIVWTSPGQALPACDMCTCGEDFIFLAGASGSASLLKAQTSKKKLPGSLQPLKRMRLQKAPAEPPAPDASLEGGEGGGEAQAEEGKAAEAAGVQQLKELLAIHEKLRDASRFIRSYTFEATDELGALGMGALRCFEPWLGLGEEGGSSGSTDPGNSAEKGALEGGAGDSGQAGTQRFLGCSGSGPRGALHVLQRAVPLETLTEFDLPEGASFGAVWSLRQPPEEPLIADRKRARDDEDGASVASAGAAAAASRAAAEAKAPHRFVLVSGSSRSMLLETTEEIEEISKSTSLDMESSTVGAGSLLGGRLVVQLTQQRLCFMWASDPKGGRPPPPSIPYPAALAGEGSSVAISGCVCEPYIAVRFDNQRLRLFAVVTDASAEVPEVQLQELTSRLPQALSAGACACASLFRSPSVCGGATLLCAVAPGGRGTLCVVELGGRGGSSSAMKEVFRAEHLADVPPLLRGSVGPKGEEAIGEEGDGEELLDYLRSLSDVCAPLPRATAEMQLAKAREQRAATPDFAKQPPACPVVCAELVEVDPEDQGPTLVVLVEGRPILLYRSFPRQAKPEEQGVSAAAFPFHFALVEHDFLGLVQTPSGGPYQPVAMLQDAAGQPAGAVVVPPHVGMPGLWLTARRNQLFVHPLPGDRHRGFAALNAPCCGSGFFSLLEPPGARAFVAQVSAAATVEGLPEGQAGFDLRCPLPCARLPLQRTPQCLATRPEDGLLGLAVSETVQESSDAGPNADEDPLGEDWSIIREPPVQASGPVPMPRMQERYEVWLDNAKDLSKLGRFRFTFDADEAVLCMAWVTLPGFPQPSLAVGTGVNVGEDLTCRGRLLLFSTKDKEPGILPPVYQRSLKWPVTVVGQYGSYFLHSEGFKLYVEKWENSSFNKLAFFDGGMCMTAMSSIKNFLLFGDLRKGLDFVQWKEEASTGTRTLRKLSSSPPTPMTVLACDFIVCQKSLGLVALDHTGTAHLFQYSPHSDGREGDQLLRSCATFAMGSPCRSVLRLQTEPGVQCLFMASASGELLCIRPIDDQAYRTITTLLGMLFTRLPFRCGLNPRAFRHHDGPPALIAPRKNIEDAVLLRQFAFLSTPLQTSIAEKMRLPVPTLMRATLPYASNSLFALRPAPPAPTGVVVATRS